MAVVTQYVKSTKCTVQYTAGAAVVVNQIIVLGAAGAVSVGVAQTALAASGDIGSVDIGGTYVFPKTSTAVIAQGETVDWDVSAGEVDDNAATAGSGDVSDFGVALAAAGNGTTTVTVKLLPGNGTIT